MFGELDTFVDRLFIIISGMAGAIGAVAIAYNVRMIWAIGRLEKEIEERKNELTACRERYLKQNHDCEQELSRMTAEMLRMASMIMPGGKNDEKNSDN